MSLYLATHGDVDNLRFDTSLNQTGFIQAEDFSNQWRFSGVKNIYVAASQRCRNTVLPFYVQQKQKGATCRILVSYDLLPAWSHGSELKPFHVNNMHGIPQQYLDGILPPPGENKTHEYERIGRWYREVLWPTFLQSPVPTVVVADEDIIAQLVYVIMRREGIRAAESVVKTIHKGCMLQFEGNGFGLSFSKKIR